MLAPVALALSACDANEPRKVRLTSGSTKPDGTDAESVKRNESLMLSTLLLRSKIKYSPGQAVTVMGDSISHGAQAGGPLYLHSWVNIFKRCFNNEFETYSYGYAPVPTINGNREIHEVLFLPDIKTWVTKEAKQGADIPQGLSFTSSVTGSSVVMSVPIFQGICRVHYVRRRDGAIASVRVNGVEVGKFSSVGEYDVSQYYDIEMSDHKGKCKVEVTNTNGGNLELIGYSFFSKEKSELVLNNYSISGRRLAYMSDYAIDCIFNNSALVIMALGYNDSVNVNTDKDYAKLFKKRIDHLIFRAITTNTPMVVPDLCWNSEYDSEVRSQLRRLAVETGGLYIPFPDYFKADGQVTGNAYRSNVLKYFADGAHPNQDGHKLIAEVMAKSLNLSVSTKDQALKYHDWWYPLQLLNTGVDNIRSSYDTVSAIKRNGDHYILRHDLKGIGGDSARGVQESWDVKSGIINLRKNTIPLSLNVDGSANGTLIIDHGGKITAFPSKYNTTREHENFSVIL